MVSISHFLSFVSAYTIFTGRNTFVSKIWVRTWEFNIFKKLINKGYSTFKCNSNALYFNLFGWVLREELQKRILRLIRCQKCLLWTVVVFYSMFFLILYYLSLFGLSSISLSIFAFAYLTLALFCLIITHFVLFGLLWLHITHTSLLTIYY
jgi:hypothetical protein